GPGRDLDQHRRRLELGVGGLEGDDVAVEEDCRLHGLAVHEGAARAPVVRDRDAVVVPGDLDVGETDALLLGAHAEMGKAARPDEDAHSALQLVGKTVRRPALDHQLRKVAWSASGHVVLRPFPRAAPTSVNPGADYISGGWRSAARGITGARPGR